MKVKLKHPSGNEWTLDLPGATREDCDLLARWLAHILTPDNLHDRSHIPAYFNLEIW